MAADGAEENYNGLGHTPIMVHCVRVWSRASKVQLVLGGDAALQCFNSMQ